MQGLFVLRQLSRQRFFAVVVVAVSAAQTSDTYGGRPSRLYCTAPWKFPKTLLSYAARSSPSASGAHGFSASGIAALVPMGLVEVSSAASASTPAAAAVAHAAEPPMSG